MIEPIALCIEDLDCTDAGRRYVRCVAIAGASPGLGLLADGAATWQTADGVVCELWVAGDGRLALLRPGGAPPFTLRRGGRHLDVPQDKPVFVLDGDRLELGGRNLLVHVHGQAPNVVAPSFLPVREAGAGGRMRAAVAAMALGAAVAAGGCAATANASPPKDEPVDVRDFPPKVAPANPKELPDPGGADVDRPRPGTDQGTADKKDPNKGGESTPPDGKEEPDKAPVK